jgi:uncharacterized protein (DUF952 family)
VPPITFHLVPRAEWDASDTELPYTPTDFEREGFVHCTDGEDEVAATANRYFRDLSDELLVLTIDRSRLSAPVRYDDPGSVYPHVYGPIDREAILQVRSMRRRDDGHFEVPIR